MKNFIVIVILLSSVNLLVAQRLTPLSRDVETTVDGVKAIFATAPGDRDKESKALMEQFALFWNSPSCSANARADFIEIANYMIEKKMRPYPHFQSYLLAEFAFTGSNYAKQHHIWRDVVIFHANKDATRFHKIMEIYTLFFTKNYLAEGTNISWKVLGTLKEMGVKEEPYLKFEDVDFIGFSRQDSLLVNTTSGIYYPSSARWKGKGGMIYWDRAGLRDQAKVQLDQYEIDTRFARVEGENALLYYPRLFSKPIKGKVEEKAGLETTEEKATYPRFKSYDEQLTIFDLYENVDYKGGFEMRGASIMGSSSEDNMAHIYIKKDKKNIVNCSSRHFLFRPKSVQAEDANVVIYIEEDSLYHPSANLKFSSDTKELIISRPKIGVGRAPFIDTYHKLDITAEAIVWKIDEARVRVKPLVGETTASPAIFESQNYYDPSLMRSMQGFNDISPLYTLWELFNANKFQPVSFSKVVSHFRRSESDVRQMLIDFAAAGFVEYHTDRDKIVYRSKMARYLNNDTGKKDYDAIRLESKMHQASLDLLTNELRINGCEFFMISEAQIVNVYPAGEKVTVKKNRNMDFAGRVVGGLFDFAAHGCHFDYDKFQIEMDVIDSLIMFVEDKNGGRNMYGDYQLRKLQNVIEELAGTLSVDMPGNKSGRVDYPDYPIFESRKNGKVFYDNYANNRGVYHRDRFWYHVDPFVIKNMDNFDTDSMQFNGRLISGGIFPDISQPLVARPDFSLGFVYKTGTAGLPLYEGKGIYNNKIDLSNRGLRGTGEIKYITSRTTSDSIFFFLDSLNAKANKHEVAPMEGEPQYPHATLFNGYLHWMPYQDEMFVHTRKTPMQIFDEIQLTGYSQLTPLGMFGRGVTKLKRADLTSKRFHFKHHEMLADTADMRIFSLDASDFAFSTKNYNSRIDFKTRVGTFVSNGEASELVFVKNEFKAQAKASSFDWDTIDEDVLRFRWEEDPYKDVDIDQTASRELVDMKSSGNELVATNPDKKGLHFNALTAEYNFTKNIIKAHGVRFINTGDAAVIPEHGEVLIYEKADIASLTNARLLAGRENKFHEIYHAGIKIFTATKFRGTGDYDYIDENEQVQTLHFDTLWFNKHTIGHAKIPLELNFKFSSHFAFDGRAELHSDQPTLFYAGGVELLHDCHDSIKPVRLRILQNVDPKNILIEISSKSKDVTDRKAVVAIASTNREGRIYTCFGAAKDQFNDAEYISVNGFITYDKNIHAFKAASLAKLQNPDTIGNMVILDDYQCITTGRGSIDMGAKLGRVDFKTNGTIVNYMKQDSADMNLVTSIDFFFSDKAMILMREAIADNIDMPLVSHAKNEAFENALRDLMGEKKYLKYQNELSTTGTVSQLPKEMQVKFFFSDIFFSWDKSTSSFVSQRQLPLIICGSKQLYKTVPGRIVIEKKGSKNRLYILLEEDRDFYFFQFDNNSMYGFSSNTAFNEAISSVKVKQRTMQSESKLKLPSFTYKLGNKSQHRNFVRKYYGTE